MNEEHEEVDLSQGDFREGGILHQLAQGLTHGVWRVDGEGRTVFGNAALAMMLGCTEEEMRGSFLAEFLMPEDRDAVLGAVREGGRLRSQHQRLRLRRGEGEGRWFRLEIVPTGTIPGGPPGAFLAVTDTTAQRHAEEAQAFLENLVETTEDAIFTSDLGFTIRKWNRGAERMFGYSADEAVGRGCGLLVPSEMIGKEKALHARMAQGETIRDLDFLALRKDGTRVATSLSVTPVYGREDQIVGYSNVARDLSVRRQAEELQARLASIVESSDDAIVSKDLNGVVQTWNAGAERLFGYAAEEIVGRSITLLIPEDRQREETEILRALRHGERIDHFLTLRRTKGGRLIDVFVTASPIRNARGEVIGASKVARDVTELMAARRERERMNAELERRVEERTAELRAAMKEMETFAYSVSHDLRAPLRTISLASAMLRDDLGPHASEEDQANFDRVESAVRRGNRLLDELMGYARLASKEMAPREIDLAHTATKAWAELTHEGAPAGLRIEVSPEIRAVGDPTLARFVYQNLLQNAIKFSPRGGTIRVGQDPDGALFVSDEGVGFDMAYAERLFQPFGRLVGDSEFPGIGLGLASVRRIVERHGGRVWAEARPNEGATFRFTLPSATPQSDGAVERAAA